MLGWGLNNAYTGLYSQDIGAVYNQPTMRYVQNNILDEDSVDNSLDMLTGKAIIALFDKSPEKQSPHDRIDDKQILVYRDKIVIKVTNATWTAYTDTNSMDPVLDDGANGLEVAPESEADIHVGDIVSYESDDMDGLLVHRVNEIGEDEQGWYAIMKGDNSPSPDPGKIRFEQVRYVLIGVIY